MLRRQLPAWSPIGAAAIAAGLAARGDESVLARLGQELEAQFEAERAVLTGSGTVALTVAIRALRGVGSPRVALPAYACYDLATAAVGAQARVVLYDLDPRTLGPDPDSLSRAVRDGVDGVIVAHLYGVPVDLQMVQEITGGEPVLIDDGAQGWGGRFRGRRLGAGGQLGVFSFGRGKGWTGGRGGALLGFTPRGLEILERAAPLFGQAPAGTVRAFLSVTAQWLLGRPALYGLPTALPGLRLGETIYHPPPPLESMPKFAAGVALANRAASSEEALTRRAGGEWWLEALRDAHSVQAVVPPVGAEPGWLRFPVVAHPSAVVSFQSPRFCRHGVMPGYPQLLGDLPNFGRCVNGSVSTSLPGARALATRLFTLPTHSRLGPRERRQLLDLILEFD